MQANIPSRILACKQVSREINFSSVESLNQLRLVQRVLLNDDVLEDWSFAFGFVIPNSTNTWQQTIEAAEEEEMLPAEVLSGRVCIETYFYDGDVLLTFQRVRIYYYDA